MVVIKQRSRRTEFAGQKVIDPFRTAMALTGYVGVEERMRGPALGAGYQMFVPKPVDVGELVTTIASLVAPSVEKISVGSRHSK